MNQSLYWRSLAESQCQKVCLDTVETDSAADVYVCGRIRFCVISVINYKVKNISTNYPQIEFKVPTTTTISNTKVRAFTLFHT